MLDHLGIHTPYFGILLSLIPFVIATYLYKKQMVSSYWHHYLSVWL